MVTAIAQKIPVCYSVARWLGLFSAIIKMSLHYAHTVVYGEQAASSFAKSFASGHTPVHPVDHPKVSELIQSRLAKERQPRVAMFMVSFLKKEAMHTIRHRRSSQQLFGFVGTRCVQRWSMSLIEVNHLWQSCDSASSQHQ